jgi:uncharacterized protein YqeY
MSNPQEQISTDLRQALKAGEKERVSTLRMLLSEIKNEQIRERQEIDEQGFSRLVRKSIKQREESAEQYDKGGRGELAAKERREIEILSVYMPEEIGEEKLRGAIAEILAESGQSGPQAMGLVMREMMARFGGQADGKRINELVREQLAGD